MLRKSLILLPLTALAMPVLADEHRGFDDRTYFAPAILFASPAKGVGFDDGWGMNLTIGKPVSLRSAWEMSISGYDQSATPTGSMRRTGIHLSYLYHFADPGGIRPYALLGAGVQRSNFPGGRHSGYVLHPGIGALFPVTDRVSFRLEGRYHKAQDSGPHNDWQVHAGLSIPFPARVSRPEPPTPPAPPPRVVQPEPRPAPAPAPEPAPRAPELHPVYFAFDSAQLDERSQQTLDAAVATLRDHDDLVIEVGGYTCTMGSAEYNLGLSERRARAVADYLSGRGVARDRMQLRGYGEANPIADNSTEAGRRLNRRVELIILDR